MIDDVLASLYDADLEPAPSPALISCSEQLPDDKVRSWTEQQVADWLHSVGCGQYVALFMTHNMNGEVLLECDQKALKELGMCKVGDRIKLLVAIKALRAHYVSTTIERNEFNGVPEAACENIVRAESPIDPQLNSPLCRLWGLSMLGAATKPSNISPSWESIGHETDCSSAKSCHNEPGIFTIDALRQNCVKFIGNGGTTRIVNIQGIQDSEGILKKALKKFGIKEHWNEYCVYVTTDTKTSQPSARCVTATELLSICLTPNRLERERLILRKKNSPPAVEEFRRSLEIASQQAMDDTSISNNCDCDSIANGFNRNLDQNLGAIPSGSSKASTIANESSSVGKGHRKKTAILRQFFGQRPPSEVISSNLMEYFPGHDKRVLEETVRNSIYRSLRMSIPSSKRASLVTLQSRKSKINTAANSKHENGSKVSDGSGDNNSSGTTTVDGQAGLPDNMLSSDIPVNDASHTNDHEREKLQLYDPVEEKFLLEQSGELTALAMEAKTNEIDEHLMNMSFEDDFNNDMDDKGPTRWIKGPLIGSGSFGSVYLGLNALSGELMAVKQFELPDAEIQGRERRKNMLEALQREVSLLRQLQHAHIVPYLGYSSDETHLNIFLEYVPGGSVSTLLTNYGPFEEILIKNFVRQILLGLSYLHNQDIIHRDIKGANILMDNKGRIKISDFGISRKAEAGLLSTNMSRSCSLEGSVYWMAPEVVKQTVYSRKADIWSLGCLIVEMLIGTHPFPELSQMQAIFKIGQSIAPDIPEDCSYKAKNFLQKTFEIDYQLRPTANELMQHPFLETLILPKNESTYGAFSSFTEDVAFMEGDAR